MIINCFVFAYVLFIALRTNCLFNQVRKKQYNNNIILANEKPGNLRNGYAVWEKNFANGALK